MATPPIHHGRQSSSLSLGGAKWYSSILLVVVVLWITATTPSLGCFLEDTDYPGFDMNKLQGKIFSASGCQAQCQGSIDCHFWTFVPSTNSCYMKTKEAEGTQKLAVGLISGPRVCPGPVKCSHADTDLEGGDIISTTVMNDIACQYQCQSVQGCQFWTFLPTTSICYLKNGDVKPVPLEGAISGPHMCPSSKPLLCEASTDFHGHDIKSFDGNVSDMQSCQQLCLGFNNCFYWTFVQVTASCYLKDEYAEQGRQHNPGAYSGSRSCSLSSDATPPAPIPPNDDCFQQNVDYPGSDVSSFGLGGVTSPSSCQHICRYTPECEHFTFAYGTCYFKTASAPAAATLMDGAVSGPKVCSTVSNVSTEPPTGVTATGGAATTPAVDSLLRFFRQPSQP